MLAMAASIATQSGAQHASLSPDVLRTAPTPVIDGRDVTFIAAGDPADPPHIVADFNGWDPKAGAMTRDGRTGLYTLRIHLDPAARIEYLISYRDRFMVDPRNARRVPAPTGDPRSELRMPAYRPLPDTPRTMTGKLENVPFTSRSGEGRRVRVYHPRNAEGPRPVLYVHDGIIAVEELEMPAMIDGLIESGRMAPITAVFVNSVDRYDDYAIGSMFSYVFTGEIVKMIEERYPIVPGARGLIGFSRSTVGALDVAVNSGTPFAYCGLVAPAMTAPMITSLLKSPVGGLPRITILAGTYDIPLIEDARALRTALGAHRFSVDWFEIPEGHNHTAWRTQLPKLLTTWFPPVAKSGGN